MCQDNFHLLLNEQKTLTVHGRYGAFQPEGDAILKAFIIHMSASPWDFLWFVAVLAFCSLCVIEKKETPFD